MLFPFLYCHLSARWKQSAVGADESSLIRNLRRFASARIFTQRRVAEYSLQRGAVCSELTKRLSIMAQHELGFFITELEGRRFTECGVTDFQIGSASGIVSVFLNEEPRCRNRGHFLQFSNALLLSLTVVSSLDRTHEPH